MALLDRIKFDGTPELLVWKYPKENIVLGSQLIVNESQEAVFFKDGQALDIFGPGATTLHTNNIPLLQKLVNLPFGGETPFAAEVFFVNKVSKLNYKWGTQSPIPVQDPKYNVLISVGAYGQYGLKIIDSRAFVTQLVGTMPVWDSGKVADYFKGLVITKVKDSIAKYVVRKGISIVELSAFLDELSTFATDAIREELNRFGIELLNFFVTSINIPDEETKKIQEGQFQRLQMDQLGDERYQRMRSLDVLETAAGNPGATGTLMAGGLGLGMGVAMMGQANALSQGPGAVPPPQPSAPAGGPAGGTPVGGTPCPKCGTALPPGAKFCTQCGFQFPAAAKCPHCGADAPAGAKFCAACGKPIGPSKCPSCGGDVPAGAKFCAACGKPIGA
jgi:membrane protease subunit (stomatin/prohibitin family)